MKVLIVARNDWANMGYKLQESLRKVGVDAKAVTMGINFSCKPKHAEMCDLSKMRHYARSAEIIQFMHSEYFNLGVKNKRFFVFHGGGRYRDNPKVRNEIFNPMVEKSIIQTGELLGLGAKNEVWVLPPVDIDVIQPDYRSTDNKFVIGHFPSSVKVKGSDRIAEVIHKLQQDNEFEYQFSDKKVNWPRQMERMAQCDIYIEQMLLGEWGVTALEAAALGKVVVTNFNSYSRYIKTYGECAIFPANTFEELKKVLSELLKLDGDRLLVLKKQTREWACKHHSYEAVGQRLKEVYNI